MKPFIFTALIAGSALLLSCRKESLPENLPASASEAIAPNENNNSQNRLTPSAGSYRILIISPDRKICVCVSSGGNCLPDLIVSSGSATDLLITHVISTIEGENQTAIRQAFNDNRSELSTLLSTTCVADVIAGDLIATAATSEDEGTRFLIFRDTYTDEVIVAYPFKY